MATHQSLEALEQQNRELQRQIAELEAQILRQNHGAVARLNMMLEMMAALLVTRDTDAVLTVAAQQARALVPGTVQTMIFLADDERHLVLRRTSDQIVPDMILLPRQAVAGRAFAAPRTMLIAGAEMAEALSELDEARTRQMQTLLGNDWPPLCALAAPLRLDDRRLGALVLYGGRQAHLFHPRDLQFVEALAHLISVVLNDSLQRERAEALQHDLDRSRTRQAETQAQLNTVQAKLLQSAKLAAVGELAASVAHEINNPLYAARNSLYLVDRKLPADAPQRQFLEIAQNELGRIARIISRMRDFYRPTRSELLPTDLNLVLEETLALVSTHLRHGKVEVMTSLNQHLPMLVVSADQIRQVFLNIILNACDAMKDGGILTVETKLAAMPLAPNENGTATTSSSERVGYAIVIRDNGSGIPADVAPHLFEPFYTTKPQGTGLGLAISAHIVAQHGGHIFFDTQIDQGTVFTIVLPCDERRPSALDVDVAPYLLHQLDQENSR